MRNGKVRERNSLNFQKAKIEIKYKYKPKKKYKTKCKIHEK